MEFGSLGQRGVRIAALFWVTTVLALFLALAPRAALAQAALPQTESLVEQSATDQAVDAEAAEDASAAELAAGAGSYTPMGPEMIRGQPIPGAIDVQEQYSDTGNFAAGFHIALVWIMALISLFVLGLLLYVIVRFNRRSNPTPSKTSHNTTIEVIWTVVPVLILVAIAIPSISLLAQQYETPPEDAITIKATGYQWNWGYTYPDYGGFEVISNMMPEADALAAGFPPQLEVDNRMVVPVGVPLRIQTTAADVIHSFAVPALWFKLDAVPGRLNERMLTITEPGIYYGQCSELCGVKHAYMPIAVEALPMAQFEQWVLSKGGSLRQEAAAAGAAGNAQLPETEAGAAPVANEPAGEDAAEDAGGDASEATPS